MLKVFHRVDGIAGFLRGGIFGQGGNEDGHKNMKGGATRSAKKVLLTDLRTKREAEKSFETG